MFGLTDGGINKLFCLLNMEYNKISNKNILNPIISSCTFIRLSKEMKETLQMSIKKNIKTFK